MVCPDLQSSTQRDLAGYLGCRPFTLPVEKEEQGLYFPLVLLIKARTFSM